MPNINLSKELVTHQEASYILKSNHMDEKVGRFNLPSLPADMSGNVCFGTAIPFFSSVKKSSVADTIGVSIAGDERGTGAMGGPLSSVPGRDLSEFFVPRLLRPEVLPEDWRKCIGGFLLIDSTVVSWFDAVVGEEEQVAWLVVIPFVRALLLEELRLREIVANLIFSEPLLKLMPEVFLPIRILMYWSNNLTVLKFDS